MSAFVLSTYVYPSPYTCYTVTCSTQPVRRPPSVPEPSTPATNSNPSLAKPPGESSALDDLPVAIKLNAIAEAVARRRDHDATMRVLSEMSERGVILEEATRTAILDASVNDHVQLAELLSNMSLPGYGKTNVPNEAPCAPVDPTRAVDVSLATGFVTVVSGALSAEFIEPAVFHHPADDATAVLFLVCLGLALDRYMLSATGWRRLRLGLTRLIADDPARAAHTDAAAFLVSYLLGLPWLCYRPDGQRAARWQKNAAPEIGTPFDDRVVDRCLIWLVAPVAAELALDGTLIQSNLSSARDFMTAVRAARSPPARPSLGEVNNRIRSAVASAKRLLTTHRPLHSALTDAMLAGASVGDCVSLLAERYGSRRTNVA